MENEFFFLVVAKIGESVEGTIKDSKETEGRMLVLSMIRILESRIRRKYSWRTNRWKVKNSKEKERRMLVLSTIQVLKPRIRRKYS